MVSIETNLLSAQRRSAAAPQRRSAAAPQRRRLSCCWPFALIRLRATQAQTLADSAKIVREG